ncbi:MAG: metallopeptidase TldD-related protein [Bacteroidales bacterium]|nr:metallopeptidase TldD-related protein [Bacteroidales bacterium]MCL2132729.1 metallopeptidase TldD-related protein [Bacteroidales bacterium]
MKNIRKYIIVSALFMVAFAFLNLTYAQTETFEDIAFRAMQDEMNRNMSELRLDKLKSPYYLSYLITDANLYSIEAQLGALVKVVDKPLRQQETSVMVGSNQRNNLNFINENKLFGWYGGSFNIPLTLENNYDAVRRSLWVETDVKYKEATELIEAKLSAMNQQNIPAEELNLADFSAIPPLNKIISSPKINFDKAKIETLTKTLSAVFSNYPHLTKSGVNTYIYTADVLYANSEAITYKVPFSLVCVRVYAEAVAADGEPLMDYINFYFNAPEQIPALDILNQKVNQMASLLTELRSAPAIQESYSGPVMFEGEAVGEIVAQCFVDNPNGLLAGRKPVVSSPMLLQRYGQYLPKENNLEQLTDKKVISRELSVAAIHDKNSYNGTPLVGYYEIDAQGVVPAAKTVLIEDGVLKRLLTDRTPTMQNANSSGHRVFALSNGAMTGALGSGIIELTSVETKGYAALKEALIAAAKEEDYEYAYIVRKMANPMAGVPGLSTFVPSSNTGIFTVSRPIYIYRISVKDGKEELVRSAKIADLSLKSFKRIVGVADTQEVYNTLQKGKQDGLFGYATSQFSLVGAPASFIVPKAIVFQELEVEKDKDIVLKKETIVPSPLLSGK